jgi:hypothetical protein
MMGWVVGWVVGWMMGWVMGWKVYGRNFHSLIEVLYQNFSGGAEENHEKPFRIAHVPTDILTEDLRDTIERYL